MNNNLKISLKRKPFPHLILEDVFTDEEIFLMRREIDVLKQCNLSLSSLTSDKDTAKPDGTYEDRARYQVVYLDQVYKEQENSTISCFLADLLGQGLFFLFSEVEPWAARLSKAALPFSQTVKINFFSAGDRYKPHRDNSEFTSLYYLQDTPKNYTGGNLNFSEFNYSFPCNDNTLILFAGHNKHEVTEVTPIDPSKSKSTQRIAINAFYNRIIASETT
jgi:hypothetical protein